LRAAVLRSRTDPIRRAERRALTATQAGGDEKRPQKGESMRNKVISIAAIAAAIVSIGISRAAGSGTINGADIKDYSITASKLATGSVGSRTILDRSIQYGDLSAFARGDIQDHALISGRTVRGVIGGDFPAIPAGPSTECTNNCSWAGYASLPFPARVALTDSDVLVDVTTWTCGDNPCDQTQPVASSSESGSAAACTGSVANPTAPAGKVCIYVAGGDNAEDVAGYSVVPGTGGSPYGFKLHWVSTGPGNSQNTFIDAVWAYTAP